MIRIGYDGKRAFTNNTGLGNYSRDTIRIISSYFSENKYYIYTTHNNNNKRISFTKSQSNLTVCLPTSILDRILKGYWRSKRITKDLLKEKIEIYHGLSNELPLYIEKTKIKSVVTIHDLIFIRYPKLYSAIDRKIYIKKFKSACQRADKIIAVSEQTKKDIVNFFNVSIDKVTVVYQGCNNVFQNEISENKRKYTITKYNLPKDYLLYVGTIEERKNLLTILKTLKEIPKKKLVIIGNGKEYKIKCKNYIKDNNLSSRVFFLSNLSLIDMAAIYQCAEIMIYPSMFEGFGIPILEALFSKTPVITSNGGCFSETGGPNSKYINPLSISEMKKAIFEIQSRPQLRENMMQKGFEYAQKFTDDKIAKKLMNVYLSL